MQDTTHSIFHSAKRFFSGTMLSRVTGLARDVAMASAFGTHEAVGAFLVAFRFSHLFRRMLGEGALQTAFIPHFEQLRQEDPLRGGIFFRDLVVGLTTALVFLVLVSMGVLAGFLAWFPLSPGNAEILWFTFLMMPSLLFICLYGLNAALLQCEKRYFTASVAPLAFNVLWIAGVFCLWHLSPSQAMPWLSLTIIVACAGQWIVTVPGTLKILKQLGFTHPWRQTSLFSKEIIPLLRPLFLAILGVSAAQINNALDAVFARYAEAEGPAYLWYAIRLQQLPLALFGIALSGALLPPLARAIKNQNIVKFKHFLSFALRKSIGFMLPITLGIFLMGGSAIRMIYGRGDFSATSVEGTTACLWGYGFGLIPMTLVLILSPAFYAQDNYRIPTIASVGSMGLNVVLNTLFIAGFGWGAASVAWATSVSAWFNVFFLGWHLWHLSGAYMTRDFWAGVGKVSLTSGAGCLAILAAGHFNYPFEWLRFATQAAAFLIAFATVARLLRCEDVYLTGLQKS